MKISVWDTHVSRQDGKTMHFDILVRSTEVNLSTILFYGQQYLKSKSFLTDNLTTRECEFCHIQEAPENVIIEIEKKGYHIIEMENCS